MDGNYSVFLYNRGEVINVVMEEKFEILIVVMEIVLIIVVMANSVHHDYTVPVMSLGFFFISASRYKLKFQLAQFSGYFC